MIQSSDIYKIGIVVILLTYFVWNWTSKILQYYYVFSVLANIIYNNDGGGGGGGGGSSYHQSARAV